MIFGRNVPGCLKSQICSKSDNNSALSALTAYRKFPKILLWTPAAQLVNTENARKQENDVID